MLHVTRGRWGKGEGGRREGAMERVEGALEGQR